MPITPGEKSPGLSRYFAASFASVASSVDRRTCSAFISASAVSNMSLLSALLLMSFFCCASSPFMRVISA
jgi:hypothetical protein